MTVLLWLVLRRLLYGRDVDLDLYVISQHGTAFDDSVPGEAEMTAVGARDD
jgi:hypothetical protein